jgi:hypothetical protein
MLIYLIGVILAYGITRKEVEALCEKYEMYKGTPKEITTTYKWVSIAIVSLCSWGTVVVTVYDHYINGYKFKGFKFY